MNIYFWLPIIRKHYFNVCNPRCVNTIRNSKTNVPYTTLYYCNPKSHIFRQHETAITRLYFSEIGFIFLKRVNQRETGVKPDDGFFKFLFGTMTHKYTIISQLSHSYMFRNYRFILRELVISTVPGYTSISKCSCW